MNEVESLTLRRDCTAIEIPAGHTVTLPAGASVEISQQLGGHFTVRSPQGLFRIDANDADALGLTPSTESASPLSTNTADIESQVWDALKSCYDPEIPINIVDLGLIYDMRIVPAAASGHRVEVRMTLTAPGCGMGSVIAADAQQKLLALADVSEAEVQLVWDPPWHQSMISPEGRRTLGLE